MTKQSFIPDVKEDLNRPHNITLTEGQISTILYIMEEYIQGNDDYDEESVFYQDVNNIFQELEEVVDNFYKTNDPLNITSFQEELEIKKYIRDNPI